MELCIAILCLGDAKLLSGLRTLLESRIAQPHALSVVSAYCVELASSAKDEESKKQLVIAQAYVEEQRTKHKEVLRQWIH